MKIGITYDIKEQYGFTSLDLNFTDFLNVADVSYAKEELEIWGHEVFLLGNAQQMIHNLNQNISVDLVFNLAWGYRGRNREGLIPAILEGYGIAHTGTDSYGCSLCLDKIQTKLIANFLKIPTPNFFCVTKDTWNQFKDASPLPFPIVMKPSSEGTGMGVTLISSDAEYRRTLDRLRLLYPDEPILCETYIKGDEVTVPMLENEQGLYAVGALSILDAKGKPIELYDANIKTSHTYQKRLSTLPREVNEAVESYSCRLYAFLQGQGYGRADFRIAEDGTPYFLEMAPLPLLAPYSSFNLCTSLKGMSNEEVFQQIIQAACRRYKIVSG